MLAVAVLLAPLPSFPSPLVRWSPVTYRDTYSIRITKGQGTCTCKEGRKGRMDARPWSRGCRNGTGTIVRGANERGGTGRGREVGEGAMRSLDDGAGLTVTGERRRFGGGTGDFRCCADEDAAPAWVTFALPRCPCNLEIEGYEKPSESPREGWGPGLGAGPKTEKAREKRGREGGWRRAMAMRGGQRRSVVAPYCGCGAGGMRFATHAAQWTRICAEEEEEEWFTTWGSGGASHREGDGRHEGGVTASDAAC